MTYLTLEGHTRAVPEYPTRVQLFLQLGLGIAILTTVAFDPVHDINLRARDASQLFDPSTTFVTLRPNGYLRKYVYDFIGLLAPRLAPEVVRAATRTYRMGTHRPSG